MAYEIDIECPKCKDDLTFEVEFECDGAVRAGLIDQKCDDEFDDETLESLETKAIETVCED